MERSDGAVAPSRPEIKHNTHTYLDRAIDEWQPSDGVLESAEQKLNIPLLERRAQEIKLTSDEKMAIIKRHYGWIKKIALRHYFGKEQWQLHRNELDDILQEAIEYLCQNLDENYNPELGSITTYIRFLDMHLNTRLEKMRYTSSRTILLHHRILKKMREAGLEITAVNYQTFVPKTSIETCARRLIEIGTSDGSQTSFDAMQEDGQFVGDPRAEDPYQETARRQLRELFIRVQASLTTEKERQAFELCFLQDLNQRQIADIRKCTGENVRQTLERIFRKLKNPIGRKNTLNRDLRDFYDS